VGEARPHRRYQDGSGALVPGSCTAVSLEVDFQQRGLLLLFFYPDLWIPRYFWAVLARFEDITLPTTIGPWARLTLPPPGRDAPSLYISSSQTASSNKYFGRC
jgi:hypothetical protein